MYVVYEHWLDGKCIYVGCGNLNRPYNLFRNKEYNNFVQNRREDIEVKIIKKFKDKKSALDFEAKQTKKQMEKFSLFNKKSGNFPHSELKKKVSNKLKNHHVSNETKEKISKSLKGKYCIKHTEENKKKMREIALKRNGKFICLNYKGEIFILKNRTELVDKFKELNLSPRMAVTAMRININYPKKLIKENVYVITEDFLNELPEIGKGNVL